MSLSDDDVSKAITTLEIIGGVFAGAVFIAILALVGCCCRRHDADDIDPNTLVENLLRRQDLEEQDRENDQNHWQCIVCAYLNESSHTNCLMCGTNMQFLAFNDDEDKDQEATKRPQLLRTTSSQVLWNKKATLTLENDMKARQRALLKRRLNAMSMKSLTSRQRGAFRRRLWTRKQLADGKFHWIRQNSRPEIPETTELTMLTGPHGESVADFHALRSQGFVCHYDASGRLEWTKANEIAIDIDSFRAKCKQPDDQIDLEGVLALNFRQKKQWFVRQIANMATPMTEAITKITIRRDFLLHDSLDQLITAPPELLHTFLKISFVNEPGIDAGGLLREWFGLVVHQLFSDKMGLFVPTKGDNLGYWIDPSAKSKYPTTYLQYYRLAGILIGKAMFEGLVLDVHLALPLLKHILGIPISFSDLEFLDAELYRNYRWLQTHNDVDTLCLTFRLLTEDGEEVDLKPPHGADVEVTDANKDEYLQRLLEYRMLQSISDPLQEFLTGLYDVIPKSLLSVFDYQELELFLCGIPTIDVQDWKRYTVIRYTDHADKTSQNTVITWFWMFVQTLSGEERARLLQFTTGTSRVPVEGFKGLMSSSGILHPFTIQLIQRPSDTTSSGLFPKAHTCFNRLDLPMYSNLKELETYVSMVLQMEICGFGLE